MTPQAAVEGPSQQRWPLLLLDLEATCDQAPKLPPERMEIIEVGAVWARLDGGLLGEFQAFVKPLEDPQLSDFCRRLTGIQQADVDAAQALPAVGEALARFGEAHAQLQPTWLSWGDYDRKQWLLDVARHGMAHPLDAWAHVNLKQAVAKAQGWRPMGMAEALARLGLPLKGSHHRAIDDARNMAQMLPFAGLRWADSGLVGPGL